MDAETQRRIGMNEAVFRQANEILEEEAAAAGVGYAWIFCECGRETCRKRLELTRSEYEEVRAAPTRFVVARGHETAALEQIVDELPGGALVVEKQAEAGRVAEATDPRAGLTA